MTTSHPSASSTPRAARSRRHWVAVLAAVFLVGTLAVAPAAVGVTAVDPLGDELMRVTNLDRGALGKASLAVDGKLAAFARDLSFACPTKPSLVLRGRSQDMADRGYFSHTIVGCLRGDGSAMSALDVMGQVLGYKTTRGENIAYNSFGTAAATYAYGCALDGTRCKGTTSTPKTVEVAQRGFMQSSGHRNNILGGYDRFGCGSALATNGRRYFTCVFSLGGPAATPTPKPAPTPTPTPGLAVVPAPTPTPTPTAPPAVAPDTTRPSFVRLTGTAAVRAGYGRRIGATVTDNRALRRLKVWVDGRLVRTWTLSGTRASRSVWIPAWRLRHGRHTVRWTVRDAVGNVRSYSFRLYVR